MKLEEWAVKQILLISVLISFSTFSKTVIVTDIDDTVKVSHVRDFTDLILNAYRTSNRFLGMAEILNSIKDDNDAEVFYLTNAPRDLMSWSHTTLLERGNFPSGVIYLRDDISDDQHKVMTLKRIIRDTNPTKMILFGDNGEKDIHYYQAIKEEFQQIDFTIFIRIAYNMDKEHTPIEDQIPFVTPFEVAWSLDKLGLIDNNSINELYKNHAIPFLIEPSTMEVGPLYIPRWLECNGFDISDYLSGSHGLDHHIIRKVSEICKK